LKEDSLSSYEPFFTNAFGIPFPGFKTPGLFHGVACSSAAHGGSGFAGQWK